jgi:hypothetical protein
MSEQKNSRAVARVQKAQAKFLAYLEALTRLKRARWVRSGSEPGFVLCRVGVELIVFEASNGEPEPVDPDGEVGGIVCKFRNWTWLWLTPLEDGQRTLGLLRKAKIDDQKFVKWKANAYRPGVEFLKEALEKEKG